MKRQALCVYCRKANAAKGQISCAACRKRNDKIVAQFLKTGGAK